MELQGRPGGRNQGNNRGDADNSNGDIGVSDSQNPSETPIRQKISGLIAPPEDSGNTGNQPGDSPDHPQEEHVAPVSPHIEGPSVSLPEENGDNANLPSEGRENLQRQPDTTVAQTTQGETNVPKRPTQLQNLGENYRRNEESDNANESTLLLQQEQVRSQQKVPSPIYDTAELAFADEPNGTEDLPPLKKGDIVDLPPQKNSDHKEKDRSTVKIQINESQDQENLRKAARPKSIEGASSSMETKQTVGTESGEGAVANKAMNEGNLRNLSTEFHTSYRERQDFLPDVEVCCVESHLQDHKVGKTMIEALEDKSDKDLKPFVRRLLKRTIAVEEIATNHQGDNREMKHQWIQAVITQAGRKLTPQVLFDNTPTHYQSFKDTLEDKFFENLKRCDNHS
uniref:uncharacterized protein LOC120347193 isoform X2 n=1 Tax=Styela clava TaxID=7725 RepID=UPI001939CF9B|nr:uncharacterized protein LOC120347193 isoform X2 [Styela clava]